MYSVYMYIAQPTRGTCTHWKESSHVATATGDVDRFFWTCFFCHDANIQFVKARTGYSHLFLGNWYSNHCWVTIQHIILLNISQDIQVWIIPTAPFFASLFPRPPRHGVRRHRLKELKCLPPGPIPPVLSTSPGDENGTVCTTWLRSISIHEISCASTTTAFFGKWSEDLFKRTEMQFEKNTTTVGPVGIAGSELVLLKHSS